MTDTASSTVIATGDRVKRLRQCSSLVPVPVAARKRRRVMAPRPLTTMAGKEGCAGGIEMETVLARVWRAKAVVRAPFLGIEGDEHGLSGGVRANERSVVVNWMMEVCVMLKMRPTSLAIAVGVLDRYLATGVVTVASLQLVGATAIFISSKHEETVPVRVARLVDVCAGAINGSDVLRTEAALLNALNWDVQATLPLGVVETLAAALVHEVDREIATRLANFAAHLALLDAKLSVVAPSLVAAAAATVAATIVSSKTRSGPPEALRLIDAIPRPGLRSVSRRILRVWVHAVASHDAGNPVYLVQQFPNITVRIFAQPAAEELENRFGVRFDKSSGLSDWISKTKTPIGGKK